MIEILAEQIRAEMIHDTHQEIERIYQGLAQLKKHQQQLANPVLLEHEQQQPPTTLKGIIKEAMDQATKEEGSSAKKEKKKMWLLLAERLEEAHLLGIYKEPVNTICRFICLIYPTPKHNTIRKALPYKYKEPNQSKIACRQMKGLTASICRYNRKKKKNKNKMASISSRDWPEVPQGASLEKIASSSVTPHKDMARRGLYTSFATWLRCCKRKKYKTDIFEKIKKTKHSATCAKIQELRFGTLRKFIIQPQRSSLLCVKPWKYLTTKRTGSSVTPYKDRERRCFGI
jgi:hypothetical protein